MEGSSARELTPVCTVAKGKGERRGGDSLEEAEGTDTYTTVKKGATGVDGRQSVEIQTIIGNLRNFKRRYFGPEAFNQKI